MYKEIKLKWAQDGWIFWDKNSKMKLLFIIYYKNLKEIKNSRK